MRLPDDRPTICRARRSVRLWRAILAWAKGNLWGLSRRLVPAHVVKPGAAIGP
jgi:hypothetical protein